MLTLTELKNRKQVRAKKIDYNFVEDAKIIENFENQVKENNLEILEKQQNGTCIEYTLFESGECEHKFSFASWDNTDELKEQFLQDIVLNCDLPVVKSYRDNDFAYLVTDGRKIFYTVRLNALGRRKESDGVLTIRSKDYVFTDDESKTNIYGSQLKASQIVDNKIIVKTEYVNIEYILEV